MDNFKWGEMYTLCMVLWNMGRPGRGRAGRGGLPRESAPVAIFSLVTTLGKKDSRWTHLSVSCQNSRESSEPLGGLGSYESRESKQLFRLPKDRTK